MTPRQRQFYLFGWVFVAIFVSLVFTRCANAAIPAHLPGRYILILKTWGGTEDARFTAVDGFSGWERCKSAGLEVKARLETDDLHIDFVCVPRGN